MATVRLKGFLSTPSGASSEFTRAKKQADLILKKNVDGKGNPTLEAYEQATALLSNFMFEDGNVGIDAQRAVADYENKATALRVKKSKLATSLGRLKLDEQEIYFADATGDRGDIMNNIPEMV